jgi:F-type H+-transporting ATPase subunit b
MAPVFEALRTPLAALLAETAGHAERVLGLPAWLWQLVNLVLFLAVLIYFVARPLAEGFRKRQLDIARRAEEARTRRAEAARFEAEIHERMARVEKEIAQIRAEGVAEGESEKRALAERADAEADRVRREAEAEIGRRLAYAREDLRRTAADLVASSARERVAAEITDEDRRRLLAESLERMNG